MNSHNYHVLLQYILPITVGGTLTFSLSDYAVWISFVRWLCSKTTLESFIEGMEVKNVELMCGFEMEMVLTFL